MDAIYGKRSEFSANISAVIGISSRERRGEKRRKREQKRRASERELGHANAM